MKKKTSHEGPEPSEIIGGTLDILGLRINLGELLASPEKSRSALDELRDKLKRAGGKEVLSDEEWGQGAASITGHIRTRGILGEHEYHIGTVGKPRERDKPAPDASEAMEPPVDIFDEGDQVVIVADVPGASVEDLDLKLEGTLFSLTTRSSARRRYRKTVRLEADVEPESLKAMCRNGVLEVRIVKAGARKRSSVKK